MATLFLEERLLVNEVYSESKPKRTLLLGHHAIEQYSRALMELMQESAMRDRSG
jgi:hypothetical protein